MHVPEGWNKSTIGELCEFINGNGFRPSEWSNEGLPIIRIQNLNGSNDFNYYKGEPLKKWLVNPGQLLFAWAGTKGVSFGPKIWTGPQAVLNQHIFKLNPISDVNTFWFYSVLVRTTEQIESCAHGFKSTLLHVQKSDITEQSILVPPRPEQQKIAQILSTWDKAIEKLEALIAAKQKRKKALMQQLLTGKQRFPGFDEPWIEYSVGDIFKRVTRKNTEENTNVVTISAQKGLIKQNEFFNKSIASEILDNYFLLKNGEFAYNKSYSNGYPMGAIKRLNNYDKAVVTTLYICFAIKDQNISCSNFFEQYFESGRLIHGLMKVANEGGRAHGLLNVTPKDFFELKLFIPKLREQQKIVSVLSTEAREIENLQKQLSALKQQKKGLMQQLLTGKLRVKLEKES